MMCKVTQLLTGIIVLVLVGSILGCSSAGGEAKGPIGETADGVEVVEMIQLASSHIETFLFGDLATSRNDADLASMCSTTEMFVLGMLGVLNIDFDQMDYFAKFNSVDQKEKLTVIKGNIGHEDVRETLEVNGSDNDQYEGIEVWDLKEGARMGYSTLSMLAFIDKFVVFGTEDGVKACIDVFKGNRDSLYDIDDVQKILERLPAGLMIGYGPKDEFEGSVVSGTSLRKYESLTFEMIGVFEFQDSTFAENAVENIEDSLTHSEAAGWSDIQVIQDDEYVKATAKVAIMDLYGPAEEDPLEYELMTVQLAVINLMAEAEAQELDAAYEGIDTEKEVKNVTAENGAYTLHDYLGYSYPFNQAYRIAKDGTVTSDL
ncbi:hypothetical protein ACFLU3_03260 [Chloroflexota bacterium]